MGWTLEDGVEVSARVASGLQARLEPIRVSLLSRIYKLAEEFSTEASSLEEALSLGQASLEEYIGDLEPIWQRKSRSYAREATNHAFLELYEHSFNQSSTDEN